MDIETIMKFVYENSELLTKILVSWVPTFLFALGVLVGTLVGIRRGARKSTVLLIHSLAIFTVCITLFLLLVNFKPIDGLLLKLINLIMGSETGLQSMLGVSVECETLKEVILDYILLFIEETGEIGIIFRENGAYIMTLIDLVYRIVFGLVLYILYLVLIFILYLIYLLFYSTRKYIKKRNRLFREGLVETSYQKKRLVGGIIGFSRSFVQGILSLSFFGTLLFIISGGIGDKEYVDYDFGDDNMNLVYDVFTSVGEYGNEGIYKVLNMVKDKEQTPYYLFAADLIFQGGLQDFENNINQDIYFRNELATFVGFARDTFDLLLRYDDKQIMASLISGEYEGDIMEEAITIMSDSRFQTEFLKLIDNFDSETYIINLGLSFVNSYVSNIDELGDLGDSGEILKILFKPGYLSENIPYEKALLDEKMESNNQDSDKYKLGHISVNKIITKRDISNILSALFTLISKVEDSNLESLYSDTEALIYNVRSILPYIRNLSILNTEREYELNPVLKRVYSYVEYNILTVDEENITYDLTRNSNMYKDEELDSISWISEINSLLDACEDGLIIFQNISESLEEEAEVLDIILDIFDKENQKYDSNMRLLDEIILNIGSSRILGEVLSTKFIYSKIQTFLAESLNAELPTDINYTNKLDSNGNIVEYGEVYNLLCAVRALADKKENLEMLFSIGEMGDEPLDKISEITTALNDSKYNNISIVDYLIESVLVRSALSGLLTYDLGDVFTIYVDNTILDQKYFAKGYKIISKEEIKIFFEIASDFIEIASDFMESDEGIQISKIIDILKGEKVDKILSSRLVEGTLSNALIYALGEQNDIVVVPTNMIKVSNLNTNEISEIRLIINLIKDNVIELDSFFESDADYLKIIDTLDPTKINRVLESKIFYYTLSNIMTSDIFEGVHIVVPTNSKIKINDESNIEYLVEKNALSTFINNILDIIDLGADEEDSSIDINALLVKIIKNKENYNQDYILLSTIVYYLTTSLDDGLINIPRVLKKDGENIATKDYQKTLWNDELMSLLDGLDALLGISTTENFDINNISLESVSLNKETVEKIYKSKIISATIYNKVNTGDNYLIIPNKVLDTYQEYIIESEFKTLLECLVDNLDILFETDGDKVDLSLIKEVQIADIKAETIRNFTKSIILESTMVHILVDNIPEIVNIPKTYKEDGTEEALKNKRTKNVWLANDEISKLADAIEVIGVESLDIADTSNITSRFTYDYMHSPNAKDNTKTNLEVLMSSAVLSSTLSKTIADTLNDSIIYSEIKMDNHIYNYDYEVESYHLSEIEHLLYGLSRLEINDLATIDQNHVYELIKESCRDDNNRLIDDIWESKLLAGIITTQIKNKTLDENAVIRHHNSAYEAEIDVYRSIEVKTLLKLLVSGSDVNNIQLTNINLGDIRNSIYNENNEVNSYILLKTLSDSLYNKADNNEGIVIPKSCYDYKEGYILPIELAGLIDGLIALDFTTSEISLNSLGTTKTDRQYEIAFNSTIIRASITSLIKIESTGVKPLTALQSEHITIDGDSTNTLRDITIINSDELLNIVKAFKLLVGSSSKFEYTFNVQGIITLFTQNKLSAIMESNLFHIIISHNIISLYENSPLATTVSTTPLIDLQTAKEITNYKLMTISQINDFIRILSF